MIDRFKKYLNSSIQNRFVVILPIIIIGFLAFPTFLSLMIVNRQIQNDFIKRFSLHLPIIADHILQKHKIDESMQEILKNDYAYLMVSDISQKPITSLKFFDSRELGKPIERDLSWPHEKIKLKKISYKSTELIEFNYHTGGYTIITGIFLNGIDKLIWSLSLKILAIMALAMVALVWIVVLVVQFLIKPILTLADSAKNLIQNEQLIPSIGEVDREDETGILATSINHMLKELDLRQREIVKNKKLAAIGETSAMLAHDVKKPFTMVRGILSELDHLKFSPSRLKNAQEEIEGAIHSVESMIGDILDYSREVKLETRATEVAPLIEFTLKTSIKRHEDLDIGFTYQLAHSRKPLLDTERMVRVLANIIENGIEAISVIGGQKKGTVSFVSRDSVISDQPYVELILANDGPLFGEESIPKLFESFFTSGKAKGTGLGLASAQKIVRLHGGQILARNRKDLRGVEFILSFPASSEASESIDTRILPKNLAEVYEQKNQQRRESESALENTLSQLASEHSQIRIVFLEDEAMYRAMVHNLIASQPLLKNMVILYDVEDVDTAIKLVSEHRPHLAIVDIDLSRTKNGYDFLREVKEVDPTLPSIMHSNRYLPEDKEKAYTLGAKGYVSKPLDLSGLVPFMAKELAGKEGKGLKTEERSQKSEGRRQESEDRSQKTEERKEKFESSVHRPNSLESKQLITFFLADDSLLMRDLLPDKIQTALSKAWPDAVANIQTFDRPETLMAAIQDDNNPQPDLILSDYHFGELSRVKGGELIAQLRASGLTMPIYLMTNLLQEEAESIVSQSGATAFFKPDDVGKMVDHFVNTAGERAEGRSQKAEERKEKEVLTSLSSDAEFKNFLSTFYHDQQKPATYAHMALLSGKRTRQNGNGNHAGSKGNGNNGFGNSGRESPDKHDKDAVEAARALLAKMIPELSRVISENRIAIAQGRVKFSDVPALTPTFDYFDAQLSDIEESLSLYPALLESDAGLAAHIAAIEAMKDQNNLEINRFMARMS
jgi:signal transduction histidine kinase/DNA-binding NarL/FixJ family response regulator